MMALPKLNPEVVRAMESDMSRTDMAVTYAPDAVFKGIVHAAYLLRRNRTLPEAQQKLLADGRIVSEVGETVLERVLRTIVNESLEPRTQPNDFPVRNGRAYEGTCKMSELYFSKLVRSMGTEMTSEQPGGRLIMQNDRPVLLHKAEGNSMALSLEKLQVDGIQYPAGSLMGIHVASDYWADYGKYEPSILSGQIEVVSSDQVDGVEFLRPSLFMMPPDERAAYLADYDWIYKATFPNALRLLASASIEQIRDTAVGALSV